MLARCYRGIGREVALELARQGVNLVLTGSGKNPDLYPEEERQMAGVAVGADRVPIVDLDLGVRDRLMAVNLRGAFLLAQAAARAMVDRGQGGSIVNISSIASRLDAPAMGAYAVSKAGIETLSRVMAMELASQHIRVNSLLPGVIETSRMDRAFASPGWNEHLKKFIPLGTPGDGSEIAWMCTYLCSDMGAWITGQEIAVDGGTTWH